MNETSVVNGAPVAATAATPKKPAKTAKASAKRRAKKSAPAKSSKPASRPKKKLTAKGGGSKVPGRKRAGKKPGHWSKTHAQLVIHAHPALIAKLDKSIARLSKTLKLEGRNQSRGGIVRALVERALK